MPLVRYGINKSSLAYSGALCGDGGVLRLYCMNAGSDKLGKDVLYLDNHSNT